MNKLGRSLTRRGHDIYRLAGIAFALIIVLTVAGFVYRLSTFTDGVQSVNREPAGQEVARLVPSTRAAEIFVDAHFANNYEELQFYAAPSLLEELINNPYPPGNARTGPTVITKKGETLQEVQIPTTVGVWTLSLEHDGEAWRVYGMTDEG